MTTNGGGAFDASAKAFDERTKTWTSSALAYFTDPIRNTDPRISYKQGHPWEWRIFGDHGCPNAQAFKYITNPTVSQYRVLVPSKHPLESGYPLTGLIIGFTYFLTRNKYMGMRPYAGLFTRGTLCMAIPFWAGYYVDRWLDMKGVGKYKAACDYGKGKLKL